MGVARLRIICGPTAAGKSAVARVLADSGAATIVSADSRQIYRRFDIGTAKPTADERARIPHFGIDVADPTERYSAARWALEAEAWIRESRERRLEPLVVGGTGLYIRALVKPLFAAPELDPDRRQRLATELERMPVSELRRWCRELDPARSALGRTQLMRAIETALFSGRRVSDLHAEHARQFGNASPRHRASYLVVDPGPALARRIETRVDEMLAGGWATEVESLLATVPDHAPAWKASGYATMRTFVRGQISLSSARERVIIETRQYAKRQRTWFRHQLAAAAVTSVNPDDAASRSIIREWWEKAE